MKQDLASIRKEYSKQALSPEQCAIDPLQQLDEWLRAALQAQVPEPTAMHLASVDEQGRPSARIVLLKGVEENQLVFYSNYHSRKGQQLAQNPFVAVTFFWPELERQLRIEGVVSALPAAQSDAYFSSRPYTSRIGAWASLQSQALDSDATLIRRAAEYSLQFALQVPRPPHWGGYAIRPQRFEFWQGRPSRLHDRVLYLQDEQGNWLRSRLYP